MKLKLASYDPDRQRLQERMHAAATALEKMGVALQGFGSTRQDEFIEALRRTAYRRDLIILLPGSPEGLALGGEIRSWDRESALIFVDSTMDCVLDAFGRLPIAFVPQGGGGPALGEALAQAKRWLEHGVPVYRRVSKTAVYQIPLEHIDYFESFHREVSVHLDNGKEERFPAKLDEVEQELARPTFCRCHKSYLVNLAQVENVNRGKRLIRFRSGAETYASKALMPALLDALEGGFGHGG